MNAKYLHTLRIMGPTPESIRDNDPDLWAEIERDRSAQDDDNDAVLRWLGDLLEDATDTLNGLLPNHWYAKVEDGKVEAPE